MQQEIKGNLAKLLASENLLVQHKAVKTASFDVHNRVLTLPIWSGLSNTVYDLLVGHEVGHALFTPDRDMTDLGAPKDYVNVTEDARIEKLMKRRYLGLRKDFWNGYRELHQKDFFSVLGVDLDEMSLADRVNLHFKIGHFIEIAFNGAELELISDIESAETFEDAVEAAKKMYALHQEQKQQEQLPVPPSSSPDGRQGDTTPQDSSEDAEDQQEGDADGEGEETLGDGSCGSYGLDEDTVETAEAFDNALKNRASDNKYDENVIIEYPKVSLDQVVVSNQKFLEYCRDHYKLRDDYVLESASSEFLKYRKSAAREVNYLVKEFECKKSAAAYARSSTARTGVLDTAKLHTFKYNEDLFKKITITPDGKNHGLVALVDWSGSIGNVCYAMVKQLLNIAWFCRKAQIPFNAYLFTTECPNENKIPRDQPLKFAFSDSFSLINVITTDLPARQFEEQLRYLFYLGAFFSSYNANSVFPYARQLSIPFGMSLGGTPLNDGIVAMHTVLPWFRKKYGVEKLNLIVLTDGEANAGGFTTESRAYQDPGRFYCRQLEGRAQLRNRKLGIVYSCFNQGYLGNTAIFIEDLKNTFPGMNVVCFRLVETRDVAGWCRAAQHHIVSNDLDAFRKKVQKDKTTVLNKVLGYDAFYLITTKSLTLDTDFVVDDNASKTQIRSAFKKSLGNKAVNKKILSSFVSMVS